MNKILNSISDQYQAQITQTQVIQGIGLVTLVFFIKKVLFPHLKKQKIMKKIQKKANQQRQKRDNYVQNLKICDHRLSQELQNTLLQASIPEIKKMLEYKILTSVQLLNFFARRTYNIGYKLNLITESNYEIALQEAKKCDELRIQNPEKCKGELFGIVMSIKDSFFQKGFSNTVGLTNNLDKIESQDGLAVKLLKDAGAIIFTRTNVPQMILAFETDNFIYGLAKNPWDQTKSTGGSSGGSAGLVASRCSPLCFGSDIGGSIRVPCLFNGITGFKPCTYRISSKGHSTLSHTSSGQLAIRGAIGPIGKYVDDNVEVMKAYLNENSHKNLSISQKDMFYTLRPWNNDEYTSQKKFKIGYYKSLTLFPATQPVQDAVIQTVEILKQKGHQLVEVTPPNVDEVIGSFFDIMGSTGTKTLMETLNGEKYHTLYNGFIGMASLSPFLRKTLANILGLMGQQRSKQGLLGMGEKDAFFLMKSNANLQSLRQKWVDFYNDQQLDAIVCPGFGIVAGQHGYSQNLMLPFIYSGLYSTLDLTAGVVPVNIVQDDNTEYKDIFNDMITKFARESQKNTKGLPVGIQVVTLPFQDEKCLNIMKQIETQVKFHEKYLPKI